MATRIQLRRALDILLEGEAASVTTALRPQAARTAARARAWLSDPNIQGLGVAKKEKDNRTGKGLAIKIYVSKKLPPEACEAPVPRTLSIPGLEGRVHTDVEEIGTIRPQSNTATVRPAIPGFSVGHPAASFGTLGCFVRKIGDPSTVYILSNSHVLADDGLASPGDPILQPGRSDQNGPGNFTIALLEDRVPFIFNRNGFPNRVDAAIARVRPEIQIDPKDPFDWRPARHQPNCQGRDGCAKDGTHV